MKGITRRVFLIGRYAVKVPRVTNMLHFLYGCYGNWSERQYCRMMKGVDDNQFYNLVAPSLFCSWFGLIQIQRRVDQPIRDDEDISYLLEVSGGETKPPNFGYFNGRVVCCDYP